MSSSTLEVRLKIPELHVAQQKIKDERKRFNVICCGRRFGKNIYLQEEAIDVAVEHCLPVAWGAPVYKMLIDDFRNLSNILAPVIERKSEQERSLELITGGRIDFFSLDNPDSVRGRKYKRFIVNEAAFVPNLVDIFNFVIRPTLIDYVGGVDIAGTPKGRNGFWQLYNQDGEDWAHWQMPSYANPHVPASELDSLKTLMPERAYQQEILAQFVDDGGGVFRGVRQAAILQPQEPSNNGQYIGGIDWALSYDSTVFTIIDALTGQQVYLDRFTGVDYGLQRVRIAMAAKRYGVVSTIAEANGMGKPNNDELRRMGLPVRDFVTSNASKAEIIENLAAGFELGNIKILDDAVQLTEIESYESERLPGGMVRYNAPKGMHDDTVIALALAYYATKSNRVDIVEENFFYA